MYVDCILAKCTGFLGKIARTVHMDTRLFILRVGAQYNCFNGRHCRRGGVAQLKETCSAANEIL